MQAEQSIVVDPKSPGGINSPHGLILFFGVCVLCSRGCRFVSERDRRGYFRFVPIQLAEGRPLAEQLGIDPDRPGSFAFLANGQARPCCALRASFRAGSGHGSSHSSHG
jgi:predicted DCC family thiol-disulfide oxidoreductase YuxK